MDYSYHEKELIDLGYYVTKEGFCFNKKGKQLFGSVCTKGHLKLHTKIDGKSVHVYIHRIQAYQKFGEDIYNEGILVRHLNSIPSDNSWDNIGIGTHSDNMMDMPKEMRVKKSSNANKKYSDELVIEIKEYHISGHSYKEIMEKYNISSKGTVSNIINVR